MITRLRQLASAIANLKSQPWLLNSVAGCTLFAGSDALAQRMEGKRNGFPLLLVKGKDDDVIYQDFDYRRFWTTGILGVFFGGMVYPYAYERLDRLWPGTDFFNVLKKSMLEIATVGIFVNSVSMTARGLLVGRPTETVLPHVAEEMPRVTANDIKVWMPYNLIAFSVIPVYIRPSTTAMMEAAWQTYISLRSHAPQSQQSLSLPPREIPLALSPKQSPKHLVRS